MDEDKEMREVEHPLDDWLEERRLPFTPDEIDGHTLSRASAGGLTPPVGLSHPCGSTSVRLRSCA